MRHTKLHLLLHLYQLLRFQHVGTVAIGTDGAINAALYAASIISTFDKSVKNNLNKWRSKQSKSVKKKPK